MMGVNVEVCRDDIESLFRDEFRDEPQAISNITTMCFSNYKLEKQFLELVIEELVRVGEITEDELIEMYNGGAND